MAADGKINIFVQLDMNGNKSHCFRLKPDAAVSELIEAVKREEGPQVDDVTLIKAAKPMRVKNNDGTAMKLCDYNCYDNVNIFASLRFKKEAQDPSMADDGKINIFVHLGMNGRRTHCFRLKPDAAVSELIDAIKRKEENIGDITLIKAAKPMRVKNNNGVPMKLSDYNCYDNVNIFLSMVLRGGSQDPNIGKFDTKKVTKLGAALAYKQNSTTEYADCPLYVGGTDSCSESNIPKARLPCGCVICADCMKVVLDMFIKNRAGTELHCGRPEHCDYALDKMLAYEIAGLNELERMEKDIMLSKNYINKWERDKLRGNDGQVKTIKATHEAKQCWDKTCSTVNQL